MSLISLQHCINTPDWFQGVNHMENRVDSSSSSPNEDIITRTEEKSLRPPENEEGVIKCPRCSSTHTKFCYYNNYSLTQPRYFCKACRRYWTKGGTLRNVPVGGGCRKNKKANTKKSKSCQDPNDLEIQLSQFTNLVDPFMESKVEALLGTSTSSYHLGFGDVGGTFGFGGDNNGSLLPFEGSDEMKPTKEKQFLFDWEDNGGGETGNDSLGYLNCIGSWNAVTSRYGF